MDQLYEMKIGRVYTNATKITRNDPLHTSLCRSIGQNVLHLEAIRG